MGRVINALAPTDENGYTGTDLKNIALFYQLAILDLTIKSNALAPPPWVDGHLKRFPWLSFHIAALSESAKSKITRSSRCSG